MKRNSPFLLILATLLLLGAGCATTEQEVAVKTDDAVPNYTSPYVGEETRDIKSLSETDIESLTEGSGVAFGGMAKLAELNGYPGPRHLLDMVDTEMNFTDEQLEQIEEIYKEMRDDAIQLGEQIIDIERELNDSFVDGTVTQKNLEDRVNESAEIYGQLRYVHLSAHLKMMGILTGEQIQLYNDLRGYTSGDPCNNVPEGHDEEIWKFHHGC